MIKDHQALLTDYYHRCVSLIYEFSGDLDGDRLLLHEEISDYARRNGLADPSAEWKRQYDKDQEEET